ncbi:hypothetical protein [Streptomyces sp. RTd22]|uniref:hypothetical protein n=1 Tax=Streptomyces sp. RTd22 TaxID=1841249 RepID=UPI0007C4E211|nr:hypothetical protein [Streptomyces sp. RTd22]
MAMQLLPSHGTLVNRMIELADLPWSRQAFEDTFARNGWCHGQDPDAPGVGWEEPWWISGEELVDDWWLLLGEAPGCRRQPDPAAVCDHADCRTGCFVEHPFAYFTDPQDPREWDNEFGPFHSRPDVDPETTAEDFAALYQHMSELLRTRLGDPLPEGSYPPFDDEETFHECLVWERNNSWVVLLVAEDQITYGAYDRAGIQVRPRI